MVASAVQEFPITTTHEGHVPLTPQKRRTSILPLPSLPVTNDEQRAPLMVMTPRLTPSQTARTNVTDRPIGIIQKERHENDVTKE